MSEAIGFQLLITCDNAAFEDAPHIEVARILRDLAKRMEDGDSFATYRDLRDINGNTVGYAKLAPKREL